jgi:hypothetical protein
MPNVPENITTPLDIVNSYVNLLSMQYQKPKAQATVFLTSGMAVCPQTSVQTVVFSVAPTSGVFVLSYNGVNSANINYSDSAATIQSNIHANIPALATTTVAGSIASLTLTFTFTGVIPFPANLLVLVSSSLSPSVTITITETDITLPLAIQGAYNILAGYPIASGSQLDTIGHWVGVVRSGLGITSFITLDDADFLELIRIAIAQNTAGSSLYDIQQFLQTYFSGEIYVFDYSSNSSTVMQMTYIIGQTVGSQNLIQLVITEGLLPAPMGVQITVYYPPNAHLFSFRTYEGPSLLGSPFNDYASYQLDYPWLSYKNLIPY